MSVIRLRIIIITIFLFSTVILSQDFNIIPQLMKIERGAEDSVKIELEKLKIRYPNDPNIIFLDAILTENAADASLKFIKIVEEFPNSKYADASVYRLFNYYSVEGNNELSIKYFNKLKNEYSDSPYLRIAQNQFDIMISSKDVEKENPKSEVKKTVNYSYTIQAGAFAKKENAQLLKSQFDKAGIFSEIKEKNVAGTIFNVVFAGKLESREDAENFLMIINSQFKIQGRVVEIGK